jgi:SAM-dependent methyltransferase
VTGPELRAWLRQLPASERDAAVERHLGLPTSEPPPSTAPGEHLVGYHASGVDSILEALDAVPVVPGDVFVDLGAGLGKVTLLARLLTGATVRGVELQASLVERARVIAELCGVFVEYVQGDAREVTFDDGTVFFLYAPFTGPILDAVVSRLLAVARRRDVVVCTLGLDLDRSAPWLVRRRLDSFWLAIYDSRVVGAAPRQAK